MRRFVIAGNWKMNKTLGEAVALAKGMKDGLRLLKDIDIIACPPFVALAAVRDALQDSAVAIGAQNMHWRPQGPLRAKFPRRWCGIFVPT